MLNRVLLVNSPTYFKEEFIKNASNSGSEVEVLDLKNLVIHVCDKQIRFYNDEFNLIDFTCFDLVFFRTVTSSSLIASLVTYYFDEHNIPFTDKINSFYSQKNKFAQMVKLTLNGILCPESFIVTHQSFANNASHITDRLGFPLVVKGIGDRGTAVWKVNDIQELDTLIKTRLSTSKVFMMQRYMHKNSDIRTLVWHKKIIGSIDRPAPIFKSKVLKGSQRAQPVTISQDEQNIAVQSASIMNIDLAGVDMLRYEGSTYVLEVNDAPIFKGFQEVTGIDVISYVVSSL